MHISKKSFYQYFKQKDALVEEMLDAKFLQRKESFSAIADCDNIVDALVDNYRAVVTKFSIDNNMALFYDMNKYYPELMEKHRKRMCELDYEEQRAILKRGIEQGLFREDIDVDVIARMLQGEFFCGYERLGKLRMTQAQKMEVLFEMYFRLVANERGFACYKDKMSRG